MTIKGEISIKLTFKCFSTNYNFRIKIENNFFYAFFALETFFYVFISMGY